MLTLNLLPPQEKENLSYEIDRRMVQFLGFWFSAIIIIFGVLMLPAFFFISLQQTEVEHIKKIDEEAQKAAHTSELEEKIRGTNALLDIILAREDKKKDASSFLSEILSGAPSGVSVTLIVYDPSKDHVKISGAADTRDALLKFVDFLKRAPEIKNVSSPVSNIIQQQDINFSLEIETIP